MFDRQLNASKQFIMEPTEIRETTGKIQQVVRRADKVRVENIQAMSQKPGRQTDSGAGQIHKPAGWKRVYKQTVKNWQTMRRKWKSLGTVAEFRLIVRSQTGVWSGERERVRATVGKI